MKKYRKLIICFAVAMLLLGSSITAYAACVTHVVPNPDVDENWVYLYDVNSYTGTSHPYPSIMDTNGNVLEYGTCQTYIVVERHGLKCINCDEVVQYKNVTKEKHSVNHG